MYSGIIMIYSIIQKFHMVSELQSFILLKFSCHCRLQPCSASTSINFSSHRRRQTHMQIRRSSVPTPPNSPANCCKIEHSSSNQHALPKLFPYSVQIGASLTHLASVSYQLTITQIHIHHPDLSPWVSPVCCLVRSRSVLGSSRLHMTS